MMEECINHWVFPPQNTIGKDNIQATIFPSTSQTLKTSNYTLQLVTSGDVSHLDVLAEESLKRRHCRSRAVHTPLTAMLTHLTMELFSPCLTARWFQNVLSVSEVLALCDLLMPMSLGWSLLAMVCSLTAWSVLHKDPNLSCAVRRKCGYLSRGWIYSFL